MRTLIGPLRIFNAPVRDQWIAPTKTARRSRNRDGIQRRRRTRNTASMTLECRSDPLIAKNPLARLMQPDRSPLPAP
jgi:hypothetical protein